VAFTYGQPDGHEAKTAKKVCDQLGVEWRFIEYSKSLFEESDFEEFNNYCQYASAFGSVPQEQEFFALKALAKELSPSEYAVLPGFCGDVQAGSFIPDKFYESKWYKNKVSPRKYLAEKYGDKQNIEASDEKFEDFWEFYSHIEEWVLRDRESKYIINGVRAYEFFGFEWYLPLWQKDFIKFWQMVPSAYRRDRALYIEVLTEKLFEPLGINFKSGGFDSRFKSGGINTYLRHVLPKGLKSGLKKLLVPKNEIEINNLNYFAQRLGREMGTALDPETLVVNEVMGEYLGFLFRKAEQSS
jgi:asparagine synthase (glutamine-hydrolysing)